jgi:hypothetical protein
MKKNIEIYEGEMQRDIYGSWDDCDRGIFIDYDKVESLLQKFVGKKVRITIEEIPSEDKN